jgi:hypothetical protein
LGKLLSDPAMKPFLDDLPRQLRAEASNHPLAPNGFFGNCC